MAKYADDYEKKYGKKKKKARHRSATKILQNY
jgi:hypothetical protein